MLALVDVNGQIVSASKGMSVFGDVTGKGCCEVFRSLRDAPHTCSLKKPMGEQGMVEEIRDVSKGKWWRLRIMPFQEGGEKFFLYYIEDITSTKNLEENLRQIREKFRELFDSTADGIFIHDIDGTIYDVNRTACDLLGLSPEDVVGRSVRDLGPGSCLASHEKLEQLQRDGQTILETSVSLPQGKIIPLELNVKHHVLDGREVLITVARDTTARRNAERAYQESEERFRSIVERTNDIVWETSSDGTYTYMSGRVRDVLGYDPEDLLDKSPLEFIPPSCAGVLMSQVEASLSSQRPISGLEFEFIRKDGTRAILEMNALPFYGADGSLQGFRGVSRDITERKSSEDRFRSLVQNSSDIIAVLGEDGIIKYVSPSAERLLGYSAQEDLIGRNISAILHPDDIPGVAASLRRLLDNPHVTTAPEFRIRSSDGRWVYYEAIGTNLLHDPVVEGLVINARDVTERKRAEEILRRRDEVLEAVSLVSERLIRGASWEEIILDVMEVLGEAIRVDRVAVMEAGSSDGSRVYRERFEWISPATSATTGDGEPYVLSFQKEGLRKWEDKLIIGGIVHSHVSELSEPARSFFGRQGARSVVAAPILAGYDLWGFIGMQDRRMEREWSPIELDAVRATASILGAAILRDRANRELEAEKERLSVTLRSITDGVITTDILGHIILANNSAEDMLGISQDELSGMPAQKVFRILDEECRANPVQKVLRTGQRLEMGTHRIQGRGGRPILVEYSATPIHNRLGGVIGSVLVFRDVTVRRTIEEELQRSQRLESVGVLAGGIAHDFNNLLTAILGNIALARSWCASDDRIAAKLHETEKATLRAKELTHQLLTFSKGGAPIRQAASIVDVLHDSVDFSLSGSNIKAFYHISEDIWPVNIDPAQISQVLDNLIANARDALPGGGQVDIIAKNVVVQEGSPSLKPGRYVRLDLRDHGAGIPAEDLPKIFEPYFTTKPKGTGLGLAVVYSVIAKHEGHVEVWSRVGEGTQFTIFLPASDERLDPRSGREERVHGGTGRVLLMDDEEFILEVTGEVLRNLGYEVEFAHDGEEAIAKYKGAMAEGRRFDAVIMDLTIPGGMGGKEAVKKLREIDPEVKAIVSSGYSSDATMAEHRRFGFVGVIPKPYRIEELSRVMSEVLGKA